MVIASNHCEVDRQRSSTQDLFNAIIYSAGRGRPWITDTGVRSNSIESATPPNRKLCWLDSWALLLDLFGHRFLCCWQDSSPTHQLEVSQFVDWSTQRLVNSLSAIFLKSR